MILLVIGISENTAYQAIFPRFPYCRRMGGSTFTVREIYNFKHEESQYSGLCWSSRGIQTNNIERPALECSKPSQVNKNTDKVASGVQPRPNLQEPMAMGYSLCQLCAQQLLDNFHQWTEWKI